MYKTNVQRIGKHKHFIFRHLTTAVDSTVCHNNNRTVFTKLDKAYENYFCRIWPNYSKKKLKKVFSKYQQNYAKNAKKFKKCEKW